MTPENIAHTSYDSGRSYSVGNTQKLAASYPSGPGDKIQSTNISVKDYFDSWLLFFVLRLWGYRSMQLSSLPSESFGRFWAL